MHAIARRLGLGTAFICVDTWLGSAEQWSKPEPRPHMRLKGGYPTLYQEFIANVIAHDAVEDIYPFPLTSSDAARVLAKLGIFADAVYLDAAHDEDAVALDLELYWPLVRARGILFGHDYTSRWPGVVRAVDAFASRHRIAVRVEKPMYRMRRPA
jgi:Methyltransferase domain